MPPEAPESETKTELTKTGPLPGGGESWSPYIVLPQSNKKRIRINITNGPAKSTSEGPANQVYSSWDQAVKAMAADHNAHRANPTSERRHSATSSELARSARQPAQAKSNFRQTNEASPGQSPLTARTKLTPIRPRIEPTLPKDFSFLNPAASNDLAGKRIVIDPGHGGSDSGATYGGVCEKDITLAMARLVADGLRKRGAEVIMTRDSDKAVELGTRYMLTRQAHPDAFLSIHCNASPRGEDDSAFGIQTHFFAEKSAQYAKTLSTSLANSSTASWLTMNNRGTFAGDNSDFYVLKNQNIPSALVELGFVSNRRDRSLLTNPDYRKQLADALIKAEVNYLTQPARTSKPPLNEASDSSKRKAKLVYEPASRT